MSCTYEGTIEIDLVEFYEFIAQHHPKRGQPAYGVPRVNKGNGTLEIDFAMGTDDVSPYEWAEKPACLKQWEAQK